MRGKVENKTLLRENEERPRFKLRLREFSVLIDCSTLNGLIVIRLGLMNDKTQEYLPDGEKERKGTLDKTILIALCTFKCIRNGQGTQ